MTKLIRDPQLDQLVQEINQRDEAAANGTWPPAHVPSGNPLEALLAETSRSGASDLLIFAGSPPVFRIGGRLTRAEGPSFDATDLQALLGDFMTSRIRERLASEGSADFSVRLMKPADASG